MAQCVAFALLVSCRDAPPPCCIDLLLPRGCDDSDLAAPERDQCEIDRVDFGHERLPEAFCFYPGLRLTVERGVSAE